MKKLIYKFAILIIITVITVTLFLNVSVYSKCTPFQFQKAGCCSKHGGVCGCNKQVHRLKCCDGATSPSCTCQ